MIWHFWTMRKYYDYNKKTGRLTFEFENGISILKKEIVIPKELKRYIENIRILYEKIVVEIKTSQSFPICSASF